jgi:hypothetical protein
MFTGITFEMGACRFTEFEEDEFLTAQADGLGPEPRVAPYELHHTYGFISRPLDADNDNEGRIKQGRACNLLVGSDGNDNYAWLLGDPRPIALLPKIGKGESMQFGAAANFVRCKADGTVTLFTTTDGAYNGNSVYCQVRQDGFRAVTPWGKIDLGSDGFHMLHASGARIDAGAIGGLVAPLDALGSYVSLSAAMVKLEGAVLALGTTDGTSEPLAKATSLQTVLVTIQAALTAIGTALTNLGNGSATAAITASGVAVTLGATAVPSRSTGAS